MLLFTWFKTKQINSVVYTPNAVAENIIVVAMLSNALITPQFPVEIYKNNDQIKKNIVLVLRLSTC